MTHREPDQPDRRLVETVFQLHFRCPPGELDRAFVTIRDAGGDLHLHSCMRDQQLCIVSCVCENAAEAALALGREGVDAELQTAVMVRTEDRPGALGHLIRSVEAAGVRVEASCGSTVAGSLHVVLETADNAKAEDVLRIYLDPRA